MAFCPLDFKEVILYNQYVRNRCIFNHLLFLKYAIEQVFGNH